MHAVLVAAMLAGLLAPSAAALAEDEWPADCPQPDRSWLPLDWPLERRLALMGCRPRSPGPSTAATPAYTGYVPPPPVGPDASTDQPPVVDTLEAGRSAADRCRDAPEIAMAAAIIPVELALCALSAPWRADASPPPVPADGSADAAAEFDPAVR